MEEPQGVIQHRDPQRKPLRQKTCEKRRNITKKFK
jgi:hypothetical protein